MLNLLWCVLGWMGIGLVTITVMVVIHTIQAQKQYDSDTIDNVWDDYLESGENYCGPVSKMSVAAFALVFAWGLLIWPIRAVRFAMSQQSIYQDYEDEKNYPDED